MKRRVWTISAGLAAVVAVVAAPAAMAAYTTAKLEVSRASSSSGVVIKATLSPDDDPTASVRIFAPAGTQLVTNQAPGTELGRVRAVVKALDLAGADLPLEGQLVVAAPGQIPAATVAQCTAGATPLATWMMVLTATSQTLTVPTYLIATSGAQAALGPAYIQICLPPPDVPAGTPGRATFGAKVYSAELSIFGVFRLVPEGVWIGFWTPYTPLVGTPNSAGTVASPAAVGTTGSVSLRAKISGQGATLSGMVTQGGQPRAGATVTLVGGAKASTLKRLGGVTTTTDGRFAFKAKTGTFFSANVTADPGPSPAVCSRVQLGTVACVNPTINGFTAQSRVVRKRK